MNDEDEEGVRFEESVAPKKATHTFFPGPRNRLKDLVEKDPRLRLRCIFRIGGGIKAAVRGMHFLYGCSEGQSIKVQP